MAGWLMNNQKLSPMGLMINKDEMNMSYNIFGQNQKSSLDLMQNCDLPPPLKVFSCPDKSVLVSPMEDDNVKEANIESKQEVGSDRLEVLKALRRSQTRAREAERKYLALYKEKEALSNLMLDESARSLAYRNWIKVLDLQILQLKTQKQQQQHQYEHVDRWNRTTREDEDKNGLTWFMAVAFCLGIAAIGYKYLF
ncbi:putative cyclin-D4-1-like [Capsicum annuum]|uniref:Uncharacterized protein n=1 Tax=Capsicum annuum TaxID=4072 RepID=A0A1U8F1N8_CAPAN|nr:putative cyclin-D4-1-like [Capsicum annuum]PHT64959.1 hypothetical protein T459_29384 [Capsicum annuum]